MFRNIVAFHVSNLSNRMNKCTVNVRDLHRVVTAMIIEMYARVIHPLII